MHPGHPCPTHRHPQHLLRCEPSPLAPQQQQQQRRCRCRRRAQGQGAARPGRQPSAAMEIRTRHLDLQGETLMMIITITLQRRKSARHTLSKPLTVNPCRRCRTCRDDAKPRHEHTRDAMGNKPGGPPGPDPAQGSGRLTGRSVSIVDADAARTMMQGGVGGRPVMNSTFDRRRTCEPLAVIGCG